MDYVVELQDKLFDLFRNDKEICTLLGIKDSNSIAECSTKIRRGIQPAVTANDSPNLFISYWIVPSYGITTRNYLVNESVIEFDLYFKYRGTMVKLFKAMQRVLKAHYEDMVIVAEGNSDSPVTGLNAYMFRVNPLVKS